MNNKSKKLRLSFVTLTSVIFLVGYFVFNATDNVFQIYVPQHHLSYELFAKLNIRSGRWAFIIMAVCLLKSFQNLTYQRYLMLALLTTLLFFLLASISLETYPYISAISNAIYCLTEPWRQLYVPSALRGSVEGITESLTGVIDLSVIGIEARWEKHLGRFHSLIIVIAICFLFFWLLTILLEKNVRMQSTQHTTKIVDLIVQNPSIFIFCGLGGINEGMYSYVYIFAEEALASMPPQYYQYICAISGIIGPVVLGMIADKKGFFSVAIFSAISLMICKFIYVVLMFSQITSPMAYYTTVFFESAFATSVVALSITLIGDRLNNQGIFRSFTLSNIFFGVGMLITARLEGWTSPSLWKMKLTMGCVNGVLIAVILYFYRQEKKVATT